MVLTLTANNDDRIVNWVMDPTFDVDDQYLLVSIANNNAMDMVKVVLSSDATSADLSSFGKSSKVLVKLEQLDAGGNTLKSPTITLDALQIPQTPVLESAFGIDDGIVAQFTVPPGSAQATKVIIIINNLDDGLDSIEKIMPSVMVNGSYQVSVTSAEMSIIQVNSSSSYEVSLMLRTSDGDSDVSNVLSATPSILPNSPNLISVVSGGSGSATVSWSPPNDSAYWTTTAITLYVYPTGNTSNISEYPVDYLTSTSKTISNLTNGTSYSFYLKYSNDVGVGESSNTISFTSYGNPDPVGDFKVGGYISPSNLAHYASITRPQYLALFGEITTSKTIPDATSYTMSGNGAIITGFNIYNELDDLLDFFPYQELQSGMTQFVNITTTIFTGNGVIPFGSTFNYQCRTVAVSGDGVTVLSSPVTATFTIHTDPFPVTDLTAVGLDQSIFLSWTASITRGNPIQNYSIRNSSNEELFSTTSTNFTISNLANGVGQTYKVVAVTQGDRHIATNNYRPVESEDNPSATATPHRAPVIDNAIINGLVMTLSISENGLRASNVVAFAVDNTGSSAFIQQALVNNQVTFSAPLANITSFMVFVSNSQGQKSNILYQIA